MQKIPCSIPILTLNSEKHLRQCLESVKDFDDAFLVDGNSTDKTLEIAKEFGVKVYKQVETDEPNVEIKNFSEVRRKAFNLTQHDWIFDLDSDEYLTPELIQKISEIISEEEKNINNIYNVPKKYVVRGRVIDHAFNYPSYNYRLYNKKSGAEYKRSKLVHEQLNFPDTAKVVNTKEFLCSHLPDSYKEIKEKDDYYLSLALDKMKKSTGRKQGRLEILGIAIKYFLRALKIALISTALYLPYGYRKCLPIPYWWRHVRYHLRVGFYKIRQAL
jgi:glycosyltransferase involved in cell wall biosynthesis